MAARRPFTYNIVDFVLGRVNIDVNRIFRCDDDEAARAAGLVEGDIYRTTDGRFGVVGPIGKTGDNTGDSHTLPL